jgi:hypothetical protein
MERLLGIDAGSGEGTLWSLDNRWPWPPWVTLLFAALSVLFVLTVYFRENRQASRRCRFLLAVVRLTLVALALAMIAQLTLSFQRTGLPYVAVLVDDSLSMTVVDRYEGQISKVIQERMRRAGLESAELSRWNLATTLLTERDGQLLSHIAKNYKRRVYFLTGLRRSSQADTSGIVAELKSMQPSGDSTRLGAAVRAVLDDLRGTAPAALIMLTDGINTDGPSLAEAAVYARRRGVPLFFVGLGSDEPARDLKLSDLLVDDVVFVNDIVNFQFKLTANGFQGVKIPIVLRQDGKPEILASTEATVGADGQPQEVRLSFRPKEAGQFRCVIQAEPQEGSIRADVARLSRTIQVRREKIRVLLVQAYPSFEYRFLRNMLARDETIDLNTVLQDADIEYTEQDKAALRVFPVRRDELFAYDVIVLGDINPALLSAASLKNLADFVDQPGKGGAMIMMAGARYMPQAYRDTPLARLLPLNLNRLRSPDPGKSLTDGFVAQPTEIGLANPAMQLGDTPEETRAIWQNLPPLYWMVESPEWKPGVRVLAERPAAGREGKALPLVTLHYVGAGKVLFHATDETWRWRRRVGDVFFARYWIQMIRYLSRSKLSDGQHSAELSTDRREYHPDDPVRLRVRFADERLAPAENNGVTVVVEHPGHKTQRVQLRRVEAGRGVFEGVLSKMPAGGYHAWVAVPAVEGHAPAVDFTVAPPPGEFAHIRMDAAEMQQAAQETKGRFYTFATADHLSADLPEGRQVPIESLPPLPLWNKWPVLLLFLTLLIGEWLLRKRWGMV